jgi:5-aminopentanamidase
MLVLRCTQVLCKRNAQGSRTTDFPRHEHVGFSPDNCRDSEHRVRRRGADCARGPLRALFIIHLGRPFLPVLPALKNQELRMKVAAYQAPLLPAGSMEGLKIIGDRVRWCETEGVDILCCPEAVLGGLADDLERPALISIDVEGGELDALLAPLASDEVTVIVGFTEAGGAETLYNAAAVFHCGRVLGIYRKRHPAIRRSVYSAGNQSPIFTVGHLSFGIMICNDSNYPKIAADMVARGAKALFVPSNNSLPPERADVVALTRAVDIARARDNEVMIVRSDVAGCTANRVSFGSSAIVDAKGTVLCTGEALREDILVAEVHAGLDQPR